MPQDNINSTTDADEDQLSRSGRFFVGGLVAILIASSVAIFYSVIDTSILSDTLAQKVNQHLELATHSSTIKLAKTEIDDAVRFVENDARIKQLILDKDTDFSKWYQNLKGVQSNLAEVNPHATVAEKELVLLGVKRVLLTLDRLGRETVNFPVLDIEPDSSLLSAGLIGFCMVFVLFFCFFFTGND